MAQLRGQTFHYIYLDEVSGSITLRNEFVFSWINFFDDKCASGYIYCPYIPLEINHKEDKILWAWKEKFRSKF